jgi:hypothetical protein
MVKSDRINVRLEGEIGEWVRSIARARRENASLVVREILLAAFREDQGNAPKARKGKPK